MNVLHKELSSNICKVKCEDKEVEIKIQRPSFKSVENGYVEINSISQEQENKAEVLIYDLLIKQNYTHSNALQMAKHYKNVATKYIKIG